MAHANRPSFILEAFALISCFFAFFFAGSDRPSKLATPAPNTASRAASASTLPPPGEPPSGPPSDPPSDGPQDSAPSSHEQPNAPPGLLLAMHYAQVRAWICGLGAGDVCDDIAHDVARATLESWHRFKPREGDSQTIAFRKWLWGITAHHVFRHHARVRAQNARSVNIHDIASGEPSAEESLALRPEVDLETLRRATKPERWAAFFAKEVEGLSLRTIAAAHGVPLGTASNWVRLAKGDLRAAVLRFGAQSKGETERAIFRAKRRRAP